MLGDGYYSELCCLKYSLFFVCQAQIRATPQGLTIHMLMRALLSTAAAARNAVPEFKQNEGITLRTETFT